MIGELALIAPWLADRAPLRALVVTGAGRAFCAGGDVTWFKRGLDDPEFDLPSDVRHAAPTCSTRRSSTSTAIPYPVIAAVNGPAAGAGFSLALQCDIRIASEDAIFACAYGRIGASPDGGMTYFLPRVVGPAKALELLLERPEPERSRSARSRARLRGRAGRRADASRAAKGARARREGAALRATCKSLIWPEPRQHARRPPPARAPRHRRLDGNRGPGGGSGGFSRRGQGGVSGSVVPHRRGLG